MKPLMTPQTTTEISSDYLSARRAHLRKTFDQLTGKELPPAAEPLSDSEILRLLEPDPWRQAEDSFDHDTDPDPTGELADAAADRAEDAYWRSNERD